MKRFYMVITACITACLLAVIPLVAEDAGAPFKKVQDIIEHEAADKGLPMLSIVLVDENGIVWSGGVGADAKNPSLQADNDTTYRIGSVSKLFTDIAVMHYVEKGLLDLDVPVTTYLPDFKPHNPYGTPITLRMLMSHSSGLVRETPVGSYFDPEAPSLAETVQSLNGTTLVYAPKTKVQYSNAGIAVVGRVLEKVAGKPFAEVLETNLLQPLGMKDSAFVPSAHVRKSLPEAYMINYQGTRSIAPTFELGIAPAGCMYATMGDLALFMKALIDKGQGVNGRFIEEDTLDQMWSPQGDVKSARDRSFGIGFMLSELDGEKSVSHGGAIYGFATQMKVLPNKKIGVAISTNMDMANGIVNRIADYALRALMAQKEGKPLPVYTYTKPVSDDMVAKVAGLYKNQDESIRIYRLFKDLYIERVNDLSLRLRATDNHAIVIDDMVAYSEDIRFTDASVTVFGKDYAAAEDVKPAPVKPEWVQYLGEYGWDHNVLYISERDGKLHALIEWATDYPLTDLGNGTFKFPPHGLYPNEEITFKKNSEDKVYTASLNGISFERREVGGIDGHVFKIDPVKPIAELRKEALAASPPHEDGTFKQSDLVDVTAYSDNIKLDIRYASNDNFLGTPVYSSARAFMQRPAAEALGRAAKRLKKQGYGLLIHDAYRPWYVTKIFWDATPMSGKDFVADPSQGSRHNRGSAVDLTLYDLKTGEPIKMVGLYDEMSERSFPYYPGGTSLQRWHRNVLKTAMEAEDFTVYEYEWWHFDFDDWRSYAVQNAIFENIKPAH
ncbi:serine hydrolase [Kordiimonas pumila]|uniref:D-alanyl-D-alanine dipeptidase n=1 Tax=Kordiimonas pumila TaxID=2161677 RepID=A0ABV7D795_9PROT|nr:serine hydrolase [Kordiimonas pumila]